MSVMKVLLVVACILLGSVLSVDLNRYRQEILAAHNRMRALHGVGPMKLSGRLNNIAQEWAQHLASTGRFEHSPSNKRPGAGENLAGNSAAINGSRVVDMWYSEIKNYNFRRPGFSSTTGHFTQVIWRGSTELGCGMSTFKGKRGMYIYVCNYSPAGNVQGQFQQNVPPRR